MVSCKQSSTPTSGWLTAAPEFSKTLPPRFDWLTINFKPIGSYQDLVNSYINADRVVSFWFWNSNQNSNIDVKFLRISTVDKLGIFSRILQEISLIFSYIQFWLYSFVYLSVACKTPCVSVGIRKGGLLAVVLNIRSSTKLLRGCSP